MANPYFSGSGQAKSIEKICQAILQNPQKPQHFALDNGCLGQSVFMCLYAIHAHQPELLEKSAVLFDRACGLVDTDRSIVMPKDFCDLGAVVHYLAEAGVLDVEPGYFLGDVDDYLQNRMDQAIRRGAIAGFTTGTVGYGLYFLHRAGHDPGRFSGLVARLADALETLAVTSPLGYYWPVAGNPPAADLTLAYGQASVVLLLAAATDSGFLASEKIRPMLTMAIGYIDNCLKVTAAYTLRQSLKSGHLGTGYALVRAGMAFSLPEWQTRGESLLGSCALTCLDTRTLSRIGFSDAAGAALLFDRLHRMTRESIYKQAARACYGRLFRMAGQTSAATPGDWGGINGAALIRSFGQVDFDKLVWLI